MSYIRVWVHIVWGTKNKKRILRKEIRDRLFGHLKVNAREKGIYLDCINGHLDHVHCLVSMSSDQTIAKLVQYLKGGSAYWANKENLVTPRLEWASEYYAISVSDAIVPKVREYIKNQDEKHNAATFSEDYEQFIKDYKF